MSENNISTKGCCRLDAAPRWYFPLTFGSLSRQSFDPQPFQVFAQRFLLLLVFGQGAYPMDGYVVGIIFAFSHMTLHRWSQAW
jgi:hypothetical protein